MDDSPYTGGTSTYVPSRSRGTSPATPLWAAGSTPCQDTRPEKSVAPRHKVPQHPHPPTSLGPKSPIPPATSHSPPNPVPGGENRNPLLSVSGSRAFVVRVANPLPISGLNGPLETDCSLVKTGYPDTLLASDPPRRPSRGMDPRYYHSGSQDRPGSPTTAR